RADVQHYNPFRTSVAAIREIDSHFLDGTDLGPILAAHLPTSFLINDVKMEYWPKITVPGFADLVVLPDTPAVPLPSAGLTGLAMLLPSLLLMRFRRRGALISPSSSYPSAQSPTEYPCTALQSAPR